MITDRRVLELIPILGSGDVSHKPGGRLPLLSARPAITLATSGVLGGIRGYTPHTNLWVFFDSVYSPQ